VLYHKYAAPESASESESEADEDGADGRRSTALKHQIKGALPEHADGKIILRAECARPCWATESKRYEAPIRIGMGKTGVSALACSTAFGARSSLRHTQSYVWDVVPTAPSNKRSRESLWTIVEVATGRKTRMMNDDMTTSNWRFVG
jgi:hypothetical protein